MGKGSDAAESSISLHKTAQCIPMQSDSQKFSDIAMSSLCAMRAALQHPTSYTTLRYSQVSALPELTPPRKPSTSHVYYTTQPTSPSF
jgi:hypothetical protein